MHQPSFIYWVTEMISRSFVLLTCLHPQSSESPDSVMADDVQASYLHLPPAAWHKGFPHCGYAAP